MTNRRGFLVGILASGIAPAAIGSGVLMPVKSIYAPPLVWGRITMGDGRIVYGKGALQAWQDLVDDPGNVDVRKARGIVLMSDELLADSMIVGMRPQGMSYADFHLGIPYSIGSKTMT